jgi:hypothetical protein
MESGDWIAIANLIATTLTFLATTVVGAIITLRHCRSECCDHEIFESWVERHKKDLDSQRPPSSRKNSVLPPPEIEIGYPPAM